METNYTFTITQDNEVMFTKDDEVITEDFDRLVVTTMDFFGCDIEYADRYSRWMVNQCMDCYKKELEERKK